jgi:hypothetical protein
LPRHRILAGPFRALEPLLFDALDEARRADRLREVHVLVGSNLVGLHIRRRYAESRGAHANVRFLTFLDLARAAAPPDARPALPPLGALRLARRALAATPEAEAFGGLRAKSSLARALLQTADELREHALAPEDFARALAGVAASPDRRRLLDALAASVAALEASRARFADSGSILARAAAVEHAPTETPLFVYGVYDLTGVQAALLSRAAAARELAAFVPEDAGEDAPRAGIFEELLGVAATRVEGPAPPPFRPVLAPTDGAEARELAREIARAGEDGIPLHRMAVLLRDPARQEPAIAAELARDGIPFYTPLSSPPSRSPSGRAARLLVELAADDVPAPRLVELFDLLETLGAGRGAYQMARALAELRVRRGRAAFESAMARARARLETPVDEEDAEARWAQRKERARRALDVFEQSFRYVAAALPASSPATFAAWAERLARAFETLLPGSSELAGLKEAASAIARLGDVDPEAIPIAEVLELLPDALDLSASPAARFERDGVALLSMVSARGLLFDAVFVPGLVERLVPTPPRPDPLLFDGERAALGIPPRGGPRHAREERFLFQIAVSSAKERLVLLAARRDVVNDRARLLSPYLAELLEEREAERGGAARALGEEELMEPEVGARLGLRAPLLGRIPEGDPPLDAEEVLLRAIAADPRAARAAEAFSEPLARASRRSRMRYSPVFTVFEGNLPRGSARLEIGGRPMSSSRLERFARCPHEAFLTDVLRVAPREGEDDDLSPETLAVGNLAHAVLRDLARVAQEQGLALGDLAPKTAEFRARAFADQAVARWAEGGREVPRLVRDAAREEIEALVGAVLAYERERPSRMPVAGAEVRFGASPLAPDERDDDVRLSSDVPASVETGDLRFELTGKIDRLDVDGTRALVVDYKFGKPDPFGKSNTAGHVLAGGQRVQLPVYARAAERFGADQVAAEYVFVPRARGRSLGEPIVARLDPLDTAHALEKLERFLTLAREAASSGRFLPFVEGKRWKNPCETCGVAAVCGPGHRLHFARKWQREAKRKGDAHALLEMKEIT